MKKCIIALLAVLLCFNVPARGENLQSKIETLFRKLILESSSYKKIDESVVKHIKSFEDKRDLAIESGDENEILIAYYNLAWSYFYIADFDNALENFIHATGYKGDLYYTINAYGIASNIYCWTDRQKEGMEYADKALLIARESEDPSLMGYALLYLGDAYNYSGNIAQAKNNYIDATEYFIKARNEGKIQIPTSTALLQLVNVDVDIERALEYTFIVKYMYDNGTRDDKQIFSLSLFKSLQSFMELRRLERQREQRVWIYTSGALLLIVIAFFLFLQNISKKKMNLKLQQLNTQLTEQNDTKIKILGILNHDLRRPVAHWVNFLELRKRVSYDEITPEMENKLLNASLGLLYNVEELLLWSKDQMYDMNEEETGVEISGLFDNIKTFFRYENRIRFFFNDPDNLAVRTQKEHLTIIMRNLTSNAVDALREEEEPFIEWTATRETNAIVLYIRDNGCGIFGDDTSTLGNDWTDISPKNGLGLQIVHDLAQKINCTIKVKPEQIKGTIFKLVFEDK